MRLAPIAALVLLCAGAAHAAPAPVTGRWLTEGGKAIVEIAPCGGSVCGRVAKVLKPRPGGPAVDEANPDPALRTRPIEGITILSGFTADKDRWRGRIYDPESGRTYRSELIGGDGTLTVKGCWGFFCRSQSWTKAR